MLARREAASVTARARMQRTRGPGDRLGDKILYGLTALAALLGVAVIAAIVWRVGGRAGAGVGQLRGRVFAAVVWRVADGAWPAIDKLGVSFLWHNEWNVPLDKYGARDLILGTVVTSFGAMLLAAPLSIAIALFLSGLAPPAIRGPIG